LAPETVYSKDSTGNRTTTMDLNGCGLKWSSLANKQTI